MEKSFFSLTPPLASTRFEIMIYEVTHKVAIRIPLSHHATLWSPFTENVKNHCQWSQSKFLFAFETFTRIQLFLNVKRDLLCVCAQRVCRGGCAYVRHKTKRKIEEGKMLRIVYFYDLFHPSNNLISLWTFIKLVFSLIMSFGAKSRAKESECFSLRRLQNEDDIFLEVYAVYLNLIYLWCFKPPTVVVVVVVERKRQQQKNIIIHLMIQGVCKEV